nr:MAG TPA: NAD(P)H dehydrogenase subunit S [Caudoviricetes sp.]
MHRVTDMRILFFEGGNTTSSLFYWIKSNLPEQSR